MTAPTARTENGGTPPRIITQTTKQRSGEMCFEFDKLSSRTENGGTPPRIITQTTKQRSGGYVSHIANNLHELRTVAHRGGIYG